MTAPQRATADAAETDYLRLLRLDGQAFIVLGAGQGIGAQSARALSQAGAHVLCVDADAGRARHIADAVGGIAQAADVTSRQDMAAVFAGASRQLGAPLTGVVDVVGIVQDVGLHTGDDAAWQRQFDIVLRHAWLALELGAPAMAPGGSFVFVGALAAFAPRGGPLLGYSAAKAALHQLVRGAALELAGQGLRVNAVAPGLTRTPRLVQNNDAAFWAQQAEQIPLGRTGEPADIAAAALYLGVPMARHVTGHILTVDGGASLCAGGRSGTVRSL